MKPHDICISVLGVLLVVQVIISITYRNEVSRLRRDRESELCFNGKIVQIDGTIYDRK